MIFFTENTQIQIDHLNQHLVLDKSRFFIIFYISLNRWFLAAIQSDKNVAILLLLQTIYSKVGEAKIVTIKVVQF